MYQGPIIDAHHHLWDLALDRHLWLRPGDATLAPLGDISYMRHTYLPADYWRDVDGRNVVGTVHIEAMWDRSRSPVEETEWLETLDKAHGIATRYVAYAKLRDPDVARVLEQQTAYKRVVGLRETIRWHPDPARRWAEAGITDDPAFRRGAALAARHGLALELLMNPYQSEEVARLAAELPELVLLINHCGTPIDRDEAGIARWKHGLKRMAEQPNIAIKVSNFGAYSSDKSIPVLRETVLTCIDAFGTGRAMFGTDYPVGRRHMALAAMIDAFAAITADFSASEQTALFCDNASRYYRFTEAGKG